MLLFLLFLGSERSKFEKNGPPTMLRRLHCSDAGWIM